MSERKFNAGIITITDLANMDFLRYLRREFPGDKVLPDDQDFDLSVDVTTDVQARAEYRRAQARKVIRMFREWTAARN
jgi:hypothetical protein